MHPLPAGRCACWKHYIVDYWLEKHHALWNVAKLSTLLPDCSQFPTCLMPDWGLVQVVVSGLHLNNTANILGSFQVCNSTVYITDVVLLPADSLQAIPQAPTTVTPSRAGETRCLTHPAAALPVHYPSSHKRGRLIACDKPVYVRLTICSLPSKSWGASYYVHCMACDHVPWLTTARVMCTVMRAQARAGQQRQLQLLQQHPRQAQWLHSPCAQSVHPRQLLLMQQLQMGRWWALGSLRQASLASARGPMGGGSLPLCQQ